MYAFLFSYWNVDLILLHLLYSERNIEILKGVLDFCFLPKWSNRNLIYVPACNNLFPIPTPSKKLDQKKFQDPGFRQQMIPARQEVSKMQFPGLQSKDFVSRVP